MRTGPLHNRKVGQDLTWPVALEPDVDAYRPIEHERAEIVGPQHGSAGRFPNERIRRIRRQGPCRMEPVIPFDDRPFEVLANEGPRLAHRRIVSGDHDDRHPERSGDRRVDTGFERRPPIQLDVGQGRR